MPREHSYVVKRGDTLSMIAKQFYGHRSQWKIIFDYNNRPPTLTKRGKPIQDPDRLIEGEVVYVPQQAPASAKAVVDTTPAVVQRVKEQTQVQVRKAAHSAVAQAQTQVRSAVHAQAAQVQAQVQAQVRAQVQAQARAVLQEPVEMTAQMILAGAELPAGFYKFMHDVLQMSNATVRELQTIARRAKRAKEQLEAFADPVEALVAFYKAYRAHKAGNDTEAFSHLMCALGHIWDHLPKQVRAQVTGVVVDLMKRVELLKRVGDLIEDVDSIGGTRLLIVMASGLVTGDMDRFSTGGKKLASLLGDHPATGAKVAGELVLFIADFLPPSVRDELLLKSVGRKIPVVGTILVGLWDLGDAMFHPTDWKKWAAVGSTAAGIIPGAGTAASAVIDLGVLIGTVAETVHDLVKFSVQGGLLARS